MHSGCGDSWHSDNHPKNWSSTELESVHLWGCKERKMHGWMKHLQINRNEFNWNVIVMYFFIQIDKKSIKLLEKCKATFSLVSDSTTYCLHYFVATLFLKHLQNDWHRLIYYYLMFILNHNCYCQTAFFYLYHVCTSKHPLCCWTVQLVSINYLISPCDGMILSGLQKDHIHLTERDHRHATLTFKGNNPFIA